MRARMQLDVGALETFDGLGEQAVGVLVGGEQGPRSPPPHPVPSRFRWRPLLRRTASRADAAASEVAHMGRGFDEFEQAPAVETQVLVLAALTRGREGLLVATEPVEQDGRGVLGQSDQSAFTPWRFRPRRPPRSCRARRSASPATPRDSTSGISLGVWPIDAVIASASSMKPCRRGRIRPCTRGRRPGRRVPVEARPVHRCRVRAEPCRWRSAAGPRRPTVHVRADSCAMGNGQYWAGPSRVLRVAVPELQSGAHVVGAGSRPVKDATCHAAQQEVDRPLQFADPIDCGATGVAPPPPACPARPSRPAYMAAASASR